MRTTTIFVFLLSIQIFSQTYLGVSYNNSDPSNSTNLSSLQKITFSSTDISFLLTDNSTISKAFSILNKITFSGTGGDNPLPVKLVSFAATVNGDKVALHWNTATEKNNYGFEIQRSLQKDGGQAVDGDQLSEWEKIGFVQGHGNSNSAQAYSFYDEDVTFGKYYYRLKQIDNDGKYNLSKEVEVVLGMPSEFSLKQNYPNPFNPQTKITYNLPIDGFVTLKVFDVLGREVASLVNEIKKAGSYEVIFDGGQLASGVYVCKISCSNYSSSIKMLMMK